MILALLLPAKVIAGEGDIALYKAVATEVSQGADYYESVTALHRQRNFPLKPFYTVRPPLHAYLASILGPAGLLITTWGLFFLCLGAWFRTLSDRAPWERLAFLGLLSFGGGAVISPSAIFAHELLAGLLVTLALGLSWNYKLQITVATCAVLVRDLAAPTIVLLLYPFNRKQAVGAFWAIAIVAAYYLWHFIQVSSVVLPTDLATQGWFGMRGPTGLSDHMSTLTQMEIPVWLVFLPLLGWLHYSSPLPFFWCSGVAFAVCVIAREDNLFWQLMFMPLYWAGLVFLAQALIMSVKKRSSVFWPRSSQS